MKTLWMILFAFFGMLPVSIKVYAVSPEETAEAAMEGYYLFMRDSLPDDRERGYEIMLSAAWSGDAKAANNVGWLMQHGEFVDKDLKGALRWYERASDQGLPVAALNYIELILNHNEEALGGTVPDRQRMAKAAMMAGTAMMMGKGLPYEPRKGEDLILRAALLGDEKAAITIAQQLEIYPDSFSYLPLEEIARQCDSFLPEESRNIPEGMPLTEFADLMLSPSFWYGRVAEEEMKLN